MRPLFTTAVAAVLISTSLSPGAVTLSIPDAVLLPNTPNQEIQITVTGGDLVTNFNFRSVINNGMSPSPVFQGSLVAENNDGTDYDINGSIWNAHTSQELNSAPLWNPVTTMSLPHFSDSNVSFQNLADETAADGVVVTAIIDTTGIFAGVYPFTAGDHAIGFIAPGVPLNNSSFSNGGTVIVPTFDNGSITIAAVPEPSAFALGFVVLSLVGVRNRLRTLSRFSRKKTAGE